MTERSFARLAATLLGLGALLPLLFRYLPMTDLPQHLAVAAILEHGADPSFELARYFEVDLTRTLYLLPYGLCLGLGKVLGLRLAMNVVVVLGGATYLGGIVLLLRARHQPGWLALLALPFLFNRAFFWGFLNFNLGVGLALMAIGLLARQPRSTRAELLAAGCAVSSLFTHVYGVALLLTFAAGWAIWEPRAVLARWRALVPALAGALCWVVLVRAAPPMEHLQLSAAPGAVDRLVGLPQAILGGYADHSEWMLLVLVIGVTLALAGLPLPLSRARGLTVLDKLLWLAVGANLVLYFLLPESTQQAGFVHFRHAVLAAGLLPALARAELPPFGWRRTAPLLVGVCSLLVSTVHLLAFDREARSFDAALAQVPMGSRVVYLPIEPNGEWFQSAPYLHFGSFVQAERGGFVAQSFPQLFWNIPVKTREGAVPPLMPGLEFDPGRFDDATFGGFFEYALVRMPGEEALDPSPRFPFRRIWSRPPWQLYHRQPTP